MGLDIRIYQMRPVCCPHCGELVTYKTVDAVDGSGNVWYEFLASIGYYKPYVKGQQYNQDMYGMDMTLTDEQVNELSKFVDKTELKDWYYITEVKDLIASARIAGDKILINADW